MVTCIIQPILILLKLHIQTHTQSTHFVFFLTNLHTQTHILLHIQSSKNEIFPLKSPLSSPIPIFAILSTKFQLFKSRSQSIYKAQKGLQNA